MTTGTAAGFATTGIDNHPGHSSQKSHGRKGGGAAGDIRDALAGAGSIRELNAAAVAEARRITGGRYISFDMTGSDLQTAREHVEGVLQGLERFPNANLQRVNVSPLDPGTHAVASGGYITFNSLYSKPSGRAKYLEDLKRDAEGWEKGLQVYGIDSLKTASFHTRNSGSPVAVGLHEFGHVVDVATTRRSSHAAVQDLVRQATAREQSSQTIPGAPIRDSGDLVLRTVSGYAMKNTTELVAEAFTDVMVNGSSASEVSQGIFSILEGEYNS